MVQGEGGGGSGKRPLEEVADRAAAALEAKKQWKNPLQVQILEDAYAVTTKPSASMKEDLARKTGLDYKQVQYWFGNRRYLDRHGPKKGRTRFITDEMLGDRMQRYDGELSLESGLNFNSISVVYPNGDASLIPSLRGSETSISWRNSRLLKFQEPIEPQLHQSPVISQHLLSPEMMRPHPFRLSYEEMPQEIQKIVKHMEKQLGQPLREDGPILGVDFSPLPPGAFEAPKAISAANKKASNCCNGQIIQRPSTGTIKDLTLFNKSGCTFLSSLCNGKAVGAGRVHEHCADAFSSPTHQHQNFSRQSSNHENNYHLSSSNVVGSSKPSNILYVDSNISSEDRRSNTIYKQQEVVHDNIHLESLTINVHNSTYLNTLPSNNIHDGHPCRTQNLQTNNPKTASCGKLRNVTGTGAGTSYLAEGPGENQDFALTVSSEVKNFCDHNIGNPSTSNQSIRLMSWHADEHFFVRPRKRSGSRECVIMNYFSDHNSTATLVAEWKENESRAVYFVVDIEINSSDSSGSDAGKNLHGNKGLPSSNNNKHNGQEMDNNYKLEGYNEDIIISPVSSERTI